MYMYILFKDLMLECTRVWWGLTVTSLCLLTPASGVSSDNVHSKCSNGHYTLSRSWSRLGINPMQPQSTDCTHLWCYYATKKDYKCRGWLIFQSGDQKWGKSQGIPQLIVVIELGISHSATVL